MGRNTITTIAQMTGYSVATVSRVLNKTGSYSAKAAETIKNMAAKLGYMHYSTIEKHIPLVYVIVPTISNIFYNEILDGICDYAEEHKFTVVILQTKSSSEISDKLAQIAQSEYFGGIISMELKPHKSQLFSKISQNTPIVQCCEYDENLPYPYVIIDNFKATQNAINYLLSIGRKKIALVNSNTELFYAYERERGYAESLKAAGIPLRDDFICHLPAIDYKIAHNIGLQLFSLADKPDAVFCVSDTYASGIIRAAQDLKISIPDEVSVIGFDNTEISVQNNPAITTIAQPRYDIGFMACHMLVGMINSPTATPENVVLDTELIIRDST